MKTIFYSIITLMLLVSATCRKTQTSNPLTRTLIGKWNYIGKSGGYAGKYHPADPAAKQVLEFKKDLTYLQKINNKVITAGTYELYKTKSIYSGKPDHAIHFSSATAPSNKNSIIFLQNDTLILADNVYDGFKMQYTRVK